MAQYYSKINTLYKREPQTLPNGEVNPRKNQIIIGDYSNEETKLLKDLLWECTEKINGTNMSIHIIPKEPDHVDWRANVDGSTTQFVVYKSYDIEIHGKTPNAKIPNILLANLQTFCNNTNFVEVFTYNGIPPQTTIKIFGEGYGANIQKGGKYTKDQKFIVFDIKFGDKYAKREAVEAICQKLNLDIVPLIGMMTIGEAEEMVKKGFVSRIAEDKTLLAEGLVCKAPLGMLDCQGNRIITKIKTEDYIALSKFEK